MKRRKKTMNHMMTDFYNECAEAQVEANYERKMQYKRETLDDFLRIINKSEHYFYYGKECISVETINKVAEKLKEKWHG